MDELGWVCQGAWSDSGYWRGRRETSRDLLKPD
jgi:hypothetical protein